MEKELALTIVSEVEYQGQAYDIWFDDYRGYHWLDVDGKEIVLDPEDDHSYEDEALAWLETLKYQNQI